MRQLLKNLLPRNMFLYDNSGESLPNICPWLTAVSTTNAEKAWVVGVFILNNMTGKNVSDFTFRRKKQVVTMDVKRCIKVDGKQMHVETHHLFPDPE